MNDANLIISVMVFDFLKILISNRYVVLVPLTANNFGNNTDALG